MAELTTHQIASAYRWYCDFYLLEIHPCNYYSITNIPTAMCALSASYLKYSMAITVADEAAKSTATIAMLIAIIIVTIVITTISMSVAVVTKFAFEVAVTITHTIAIAS